MSELSFRCVQTDLPLGTGVRIDHDTLRDRWAEVLDIECPHCGKMHTFSVRDAYVAMTLDDCSAPAKGLFKDTPARQLHRKKSKPVCGWLVAVRRRAPGKHYGAARDFWYVGIPDPSVACEKVTKLISVCPNTKVVAFRQLTGAQIGALGISPGEVRNSARTKPSQALSQADPGSSI